MQILTGPGPYLANPTEFDEVYSRGDQDNPKFFLREGLAEGWATLNATLAQLPIAVRVGFRIIDDLHVPADWPTLTVGGRTYPDFQSVKVREEYPKMLRAFKAGVPRVTWVDIPFPYSGSNEPSITEANANALPGGKARYFEDCKWIIDQYVAVFGRAVVGFLIPDTWIADVMMPYQKAKGIRAFRQDSFMRFDWGGFGLDGENRASSYDRRIVQLGGRQGFDRLIFEQTGNGLTLAGKDQSYGTQAPIEQMFGSAWNGEYYQLEATDYFNMQLPGRQWVKPTDAARKHLDDWCAYIGAPSIPEPPPGDGGTDPVEPMPVTVRVEWGVITKIETVPSETWDDAFDVSEYTFRSKHPAKVTVEAYWYDEDDTELTFLRWEFPPGNPSGGDGPTTERKTFFRTDTRGTDITVRAVCEEEPEPPAQYPRYVEGPETWQFARIVENAVRLHCDLQTVEYDPGPETAAFLRRIADEMENKP